MTVPILYGFLCDNALKLSLQLDLANSSDQGYGILTGESANYFVNPAILTDKRTSRSMILEGNSPKGEISLSFDQDRFDVKVLDTFTTIDYQRIFNIIERIYLQQEFTDSNIESQLTASSAYTGYVPKSMNTAGEVDKIKVTNISNVTKECELHRWVGFQYSNGTETIDFHIWVSKVAFRADYPYVTITKVISPLSATTLMTPSNITQNTVTQILTDGASYVFSNTNIEAAARDQNGIFTHATKYVLDSSRSIQLPFGLAYCGKTTPTSLECRTAIKNYIQTETSVNDEALSTLFPELFVDSRFYIIPLWDQYTSRTDRDIYKSVHSFKDISALALQLFSSYGESEIDNKLEIITNSQNKILSMIMPDSLNNNTSLVSDLYPDYQDYASQQAGYRYMSSTTQEFAGKLARCFSVLNGDTLSSEFENVELDNLAYLVFTCGKAEYYVLTKDSYNSSIGI